MGIKVNTDDTIAAISTAMGTGGIGIIRISGNDAFKITEKIFKNKSGKISDFKSHTIHYGHITDNKGTDDKEEIVDEVLVSVMKSPNTYTREDIVEINCHGGIKSTEKVLECVLKNGARMAEPGEFTKRAFFNGRIDLSQAEAVIDIINSKNDMAHKAAVSRLDGKLSRKVKKCRENILLMLAHIEAAIDYPEHDDEMMTYDMIEKGCYDIKEEINRLLDTADTGKIIREGINTVILGRPNVGKSSLLNYLIDEERAIVTDIPGTTRDIIKEYININGIKLNIIDTAGIRETNDEIEKMGVEKSKNYAKDAELIFMMIDGSNELSTEDREILESVKDKKKIIIVNKCDLEKKADIKEIENYADKKYIVEMSVKEDIGTDRLYEIIKDMFFEGKLSGNDDIFISSERNKQSLLKAVKYIDNVVETVENRMPEDFISMDLTEAYSALGEITGESLEEDIIDKIFSEFCLGK